MSILESELNVCTIAWRFKESVASNRMYLTVGMLPDEVGLDDVNHYVHLAEDGHAVLRNDAGQGVLFGLDEFTLVIQRRRCATADTMAVIQQSPI